MARRKVDVAVIIPDASPVLTLARIGRLDLLNIFEAPIHIVDQVHYVVPAHADGAHRQRSAHPKAASDLAQEDQEC